MGGVIEHVVDAEVVDPIATPDAERLDKRIRLLVGAINDNIEKLHTLVQDAKAGQIHVALGFPSWTAYVADVFKVDVRLERQQRRELVGYLSGEGMSQRAIADVVGVDQKTVSNDLRAGEENSSPEAETEFFTDDDEGAECFAMGELSDDEFETVLADAREQEDLSREHVAQLCRERAANDRAPIIGRDGKTYPAKPKREPAAKVKLAPAEKQRKMIMRIINLTDQVREANSILRLERLDNAITADEARRYQDALRSELKPLLDVFELLMKRAGEKAQ